MLFQCPLCRQEVENQYIRIHLEAEKSLIKLIQLRHPNWTESDGICLKCLEKVKQVQKDLREGKREISL